MEAPRGRNNKHKPIVAVNDYHLIDGPFAPNTDAKALSIGWAQFDSEDLSMKVWRHTGDQWSPQSEELPIHRNLDLTILFLDVLLGEETNSVSPDDWKISGGEREKQVVRDYYKKHDEFIRPRLKEIKKLLKRMEL